MTERGHFCPDGRRALLGSESLPALSYFICATGRSGSSLLCHFLRSSSLAGAPGEYFKGEGDWFQAQFGTWTFRDYLGALRQATTSQNGVFGAKIFWPTLQRLVQDLRVLLGLPEAPVLDILEAAFPNLHYIWIRRHDKLRQAISYVRASQTNVWNSRQLVDPSRVPAFDFEAIDRSMRAITQRDQDWQRFFEDHHLKPFTLAYEQLIEDPVGMTREILRYLGIEVDDSLVFPPSRLQKQSDVLTEEWVRQYKLVSRSRQEGWTPAPAALGWSPFPPGCLRRACPHQRYAW